MQQKRSSARPYAIWLAALVAFAAAWALTVLVPYYVNDLHSLPLAEVASGAHDPKDLWPYEPEPVLPFAYLQPVGLFVVLLASVVGVASASISCGVLVRRWRALTAAARSLLVAAVLVSVLIAAVALSPRGQALATWYVD